jgi:hypothetical protein
MAVLAAVGEPVSTALSWKTGIWLFLALAGQSPRQTVSAKQWVVRQ